MQPFIKKYAPESSKEIVGQDEAVSKIQKFLSGFKRHKIRALMLYGPTGCGKTASAVAIAKEMGLELLEVNASDKRNKDQIEAVIATAAGQQSLFHKGKLILIDEIDGLSGNQDRGGIPALADIIRKTHHPIIMTLEDPFDSKFSTLRKNAELVEFKALGYKDIFSHLKMICEKEGIKYDESSLRQLSTMVDGDLRAAINDLEVLSSHKELSKKSVEAISQRNKQEKVPDALLRIFKTTRLDVALPALDNVNEELDKIALWLDENMPKEYTKPEDLADAYYYLSRADVFNGRIRRWQHWRFLAYISMFLTGGVAVSKKAKYPAVIKYTETHRILKLWMAKQKYLKRQAIAEKIAAKTHCSTKRALHDTVPYMQAIFQKNKDEASKIADYLDLTEEEAEWLKK